MRLSKVLNSLKLCLFATLLSVVNAMSLDESGYYELVVAIDETTVQNSIDNYVDNIKNGIQDLSELLHQTTGGKFSIRKANILVPNHWEVSNTLPATGEYYEAADMKISHRHDLPYVYNPNPCGQSGESMLLPYNFFDDPETGKYGRPGKALLTQFVRLRFGAWEEHGYPGDSKFPYYWKALNGEEWEVNTCTDVPVTGTYKDINNNLECGTDPEDTDHLYPPNSTCRFIPNEAQAAKSSLMSYHYLKNVDEFCTAETHNKEAPTPQNFYCRYKSVMEVIKSSPDWKQVSLGNNASQIEFKVVKRIETPLLYILLDGGKSQAPVSVLSTISSSIKAFIGDVELRNVVAAVGVYPGPYKSKSITDVVPWSHLRTNGSAVSKALDTAFGSSKGFRNYPGALKTIIDEIKDMKHKEGAAILIVKTGEEPNAGLTPENEVIFATLNSNAKIFAIEIVGNSLQPAIALKNIVEKSGGEHLTLASLNDTKTLTAFLGNLTKVIKSEIKPDLDYKLVVNRIVPLGGEISIPYDGIIDMKCYLTILSGEISNPILDHPDQFSQVVMMERTDWGQSEQSSKKTYFYEEWYGFDWPSEAKYWSKFDYECITSGCVVLVQIFAVLQDAPVSSEDSINLSVSTSAVNGEVDMSFANAATLLGVPFAIYARLDQDGIPLRSDPDLKIIATIYLSDYSNVKTLELKDDGTGIPDVSTNDGIFSGTFVPSVDGSYKIRVTASYKIPPVTSPPLPTTQLPRRPMFINAKQPNSKRENRQAGKLLPVDQETIACGSGCWNTKPETDFEISRELSGVVEFKNFVNYEPFVWRITDLEVIPKDEFNVVLKWTDPGYHVAGGAAALYQYYMCRHQNFDMVLNNFTDAEPLDTKYINPRPPGTPREEEFIFGTGGKYYFAIRARVGRQEDIDMAKVIPLIVSAELVNQTVSTTTTTTTTLRPTTSSTTPRATVITESTPLEIETTTTANTRTSPIRSTTPKLTTVTTTTVRTTTVTSPPTTEKPTKYWYQQTEGIITLSVFGGAILLLLSGGLIFARVTGYRFS